MICINSIGFIKYYRPTAVASLEHVSLRIIFKINASNKLRMTFYLKKKKKNSMLVMLNTTHDLRCVGKTVWWECKTVYLLFRTLLDKSFKRFYFQKIVKVEEIPFNICEIILLNKYLIKNFLCIFSLMLSHFYRCWMINMPWCVLVVDGRPLVLTY